LPENYEEHEEIDEYCGAVLDDTDDDGLYLV
jgi:hypothetical protein